MVFPGRFADHILPHQVHILNVAFLVPKLRREFGGCAGNIAYNVKLLGGEAWPMATIGDDAQPYSDRLDRLQISQKFVRRIEGSVIRLKVAHLPAQSSAAASYTSAGTCCARAVQPAVASMRLTESANVTR